jgi:hypothetical protein
MFGNLNSKLRLASSGAADYADNYFSLGYGKILC